MDFDNTHYLIMDFNGEGCFGKVAQCFDLITFEMVAIKIHKDSDDPTIQREVAMLEAVRALDPHKKNILRFMENIMFNNLSCLAFEMLDRSLWDLMDERNWEPLSTSEIGPVTHRLLFAFEALKNIGIMHTDLKPANIMLVQDQADRLRSGPSSKQVTLGLPLSEYVDMWGVGCDMAFMYFGQHLFPDNSKWDHLEYEDWMAFLDLQNWCLHPDTKCRIIPRRALKHPFVTMVHLVDKVERGTYALSAIQFMTVSHQQHFDGSYHDWVYEDSAFVKFYCHDSNTALMTDLQKEPSTG
uniref:Protein kinase domain-containing protein n=1 Tax=Seriola lalandi dorsalis TaxID=1841481 RepID=A0A3B4YMW9_SERLL